MMLMEEAERIAVEEHGSHKISVISGACTCICTCAMSVYRHVIYHRVQ